MAEEVFKQPENAKDKPREVSINVDKVLEDVKKNQIQEHNHYKRVRDVLKIIYLCPMDEEIKTVMRLNIWGADPGSFAPLPVEIISQKTGLTFDEVKRIIEIGKKNCEIFLAHKEDAEIYEEFRRNENTLKNDMFATQPYQKRRFSV